MPDCQVAIRKNMEMVNLVWSGWTMKGVVNLPYISLYSFSISK